MDAKPPSHLNPRKSPRQARSAVTVDAIFEATIQVLLAEGVQRLTTTRVAQRAGVSVGTMYQYFPHKEALLYALNERHLNRLAERMEAVCRSHHGASSAVMVEALVTAYWEAKTERSEVTRVLYASAVELDNAALIEAFAARMDAATAAMLNSASDARSVGSALVHLTILSVVFGTVRHVFERDLPTSTQREIRRELVTMCLAYLQASKGSVILADMASAEGSEPRARFVGPCSLPAPDRAGTSSPPQLLSPARVPGGTMSDRTIE